MLELEGVRVAKGVAGGVVKGISGKLAGVVFRRTKHGLVLAKAPEKTAAQTEEQQRGRAMFGAASRRWARELTDAERAGWEAAAERLGHRCGQTLFNGASWLLEASGRGWRKSAPAGAPPPPVVRVEATWRDGGGTLVLRVAWAGEVAARAMLFVESTGPSVSPARKPLERELRAVCGLRAESFAAVGEGTQEFVFRDVLRPVKEGSRVGLRVRLVSAEGVAGEAWWGEVRGGSSHFKPCDSPCCHNPGRAYGTAGRARWNLGEARRQLPYDHPGRPFPIEKNRALCRSFRGEDVRPVPSCRIDAGALKQWGDVPEIPTTCPAWSCP